MKKVKLMLVSLSVLAVVGGALAFTAKNSILYCTALPESGSCEKACPATGKIKTTSDQNMRVCTAVTNGNPQDPCNGVTCTAIVNSTFE